MSAFFSQRTRIRRKRFIQEWSRSTTQRRARRPWSTFGDLFVAARLDVWRVAPSAGFAADNVRIESLVAAKMLRATRSRTGTPNRNAVERGAEEFLIVAICAVNRHAQRHTATVGQHRSLDTQLAPIRRVCPGFFPRPREPWWSSRRDFATSIGCRAAGRSAATNTSTALRNTPRRAHSWKYRCKVLPDPNSRGAAFHWQPVRRT